MTDKKKKWLGMGVVFVLQALFFAFLPMAGDDWAWGGTEGLQRLATMFDGYNGRYLGNIAVIILTRSVLLRAVIMSLTVLLICELIARIVSEDNRRFYVTAAYCLILMLIPLNANGMFKIASQTLFWVSGFCNYVLPVVFVLYYYYILINCKEKTVTKAKTACLFFSSFFSALFTENVTLFSVAFCAGCFIVHSIREKRLNIPSGVCFAGSTIGAAVMFSNSSYRLIAKGEYSDHLREIGFLDSVSNSFEEIGEVMFVKWYNAFLFFALLAVLIVLTVFLVLKHKQKTIVFLPLICNVILTLPLLFTSSGKEIYITAPRCHFLQYIFTVIYVLMIIRHITTEKSKIYSQKVMSCLVIVCAAFFIISAVGEVRLCAFESKRIAIIEKDVADNKQEVRFYLHPHKLMIRQSGVNLYEGVYETRAKEYYKIPQDKTLVPYSP